MAAKKPVIKIKQETEIIETQTLILREKDSLTLSLKTHVLVDTLKDKFDETANIAYELIVLGIEGSKVTFKLNKIRKKKIGEPVVKKK